MIVELFLDAKDLDIDLNAVSHHDETTDDEEPTSTTNVDVPVTFFLQTGNSFHTPSYFKVRCDPGCFPEPEFELM